MAEDLSGPTPVLEFRARAHKCLLELLSSNLIRGHIIV